MQQDTIKQLIYTLRPRKNGRHFADDTFKHIFLNKNVRISIKISLKLLHKGLLYNIPALVQIMAWPPPPPPPWLDYRRIYASLGLNELISPFPGLLYHLNSMEHVSLVLTHWGRVTHICVGNLTIIGPDNGLSPGRRQGIIWTNAGILLIGPWGTNLSEILIGIQTFSFKKIHLKMSSAKWRPFCVGLNELSVYLLTHFAYWYISCNNSWQAYLRCPHLSILVRDITWYIPQTRMCVTRLQWTEHFVSSGQLLLSMWTLLSFCNINPIYLQITTIYSGTFDQQRLAKQAST